MGWRQRWADPQSMLLYHLPQHHLNTHATGLLGTWDSGLHRDLLRVSWQLHRWVHIVSAFLESLVRRYSDPQPLGERVALLREVELNPNSYPGEPGPLHGSSTLTYFVIRSSWARTPGTSTPTMHETPCTELPGSGRSTEAHQRAAGRGLSWS